MIELTFIYIFNSMMIRQSDNREFFFFSFIYNFLTIHFSIRCIGMYMQIPFIPN